MDANLERQRNMVIKKTIRNLKANNIDAVCLDRKEDVVPLLETLLVEGETVAVGGSQSLFECDVIKLLRSGKYNFIDRYGKDLTPDEIRKVYLDSMDADTYLTSTNAITMHGELYLVDGNGNRVSAVTWGPKRVIMVASSDKIVPDLATAVKRVKTCAAPANCIRLDKDTYCAKNGVCLNPDCDSANLMANAAGACNDTICCSSLILSRQRNAGRILVLIVKDHIGY